MKVAAQAARYLARVGAYRYLDSIYGVLRGREGVELPTLDDDTGLVPCGCARCQNRPGDARGRRKGHDTGAFKVYAEAERTALAALERLTVRDDVQPILEAVKLGVEEGDRLRSRLLRLQRPQDRLIPGRGGWLKAAPAAQNGGGEASADIPRTTTHETAVTA